MNSIGSRTHSEVRVYLTPVARQSINDAAAYLRNYSPDAAKRFRKRVQARTESLTRNPQLGRIVPEYGVQQVRELIDGDYRIWYRLYDDRIEVLAVLHGARNV